MSDYIKQLEEQNEELKQSLAQAQERLVNSVPVVWRRLPLNEDRQDLHFGKSKHYIATLMHTKTDIHVPGCFWQLSFIQGQNSFHLTEEEAKQFALEQLQ